VTDKFSNLGRVVGFPGNHYSATFIDSKAYNHVKKTVYDAVGRKVELLLKTVDLNQMCILAVCTVLTSVACQKITHVTPRSYGGCGQ
jgi:hypothetical protein